MILYDRALPFNLTAAVGQGLDTDGLQQERVIFRRMGFANTTALQDVVNFNPTTTTTATNFTLNTPLEVVSSSVVDSATGSGARVVRIKGLMEDGTFGFEDVVLAGTTPVQVTTNFRNVNSMLVVSANSVNGFPAGVVTLRNKLTPTIVYLQLALSSISESSFFTTPAGTKAVITSFSLAATHGTSSVLTRLCLMKSQDGQIFTPIWDVSVLGSSTQQIQSTIAVMPLETIKLAAVPSATNANLRVTGTMEIAVIKL